MILSEVFLYFLLGDLQSFHSGCGLHCVVVVGDPISPITSFGVSVLVRFWALSWGGLHGVLADFIRGAGVGATADRRSLVQNGP